MNHDDTPLPTEVDPLDEWIGSLLRSDAAAEADGGSPRVVAAMVQRVAAAERRRSRRRRTAVLAVAAAIMAAATWRLAAPRPQLASPTPANMRDREAASITHRDSTAGPSRAVVRTSAKLPRATFVTGSDAIAVPLASDDPQVSIVQVYSTTVTARRWRELAQNAGRTGQDGG